MAMRHRTLPIEGVQFHPESVLTEGGHLMLANWVAACGHPEALERAPELAAEVEPAAGPPSPPADPLSPPLSGRRAVVRGSGSHCWSTRSPRRCLSLPRSSPGRSARSTGPGLNVIGLHWPSTRNGGVGSGTRRAVAGRCGRHRRGRGRVGVSMTSATLTTMVTVLPFVFLVPAFGFWLCTLPASSAGTSEPSSGLALKPASRGPDGFRLAEVLDVRHLADVAPGDGQGHLGALRHLLPLGRGHVEDDVLVLVAVLLHDDDGTFASLGEPRAVDLAALEAVGMADLGLAADVHRHLTVLGQRGAGRRVLPGDRAPLQVLSRPVTARPPVPARISVKAASCVLPARLGTALVLASSCPVEPDQQGRDRDHRQHRPRRDRDHPGGALRRCGSPTRPDWRGSADASGSRLPRRHRGGLVLGHHRGGHHRPAGGGAEQVGPHLGGALVPVERVLGQRLEHDRVDRRGHVGVDVAGRRRVLPDVLVRHATGLSPTNGGWPQSSSNSTHPAA